MEEENYQKELFEFEKPKRAFPRLANLFRKPAIERNIAVTISLERLIFIFIGIIMAMIIVYALGVETGKARGKNYKVMPAAAKMQAIVKPAAPVMQVAKAPAQNLANKPYTIIAGSYSRKESALQAFNRLKKEGLDAAIILNNSFYQVRVGSYGNRNDPQALKNLKKVQQTYKDAYLKLR